LLLFSLSSSSRFCHRKSSFRRGLHRVFLYRVSRGEITKLEKKSRDFFSSFFRTSIDVHHEASASSSSAATPPRVRVLVSFSLFLSLSISLFLSLSLSRKRCSFFFLHIQKLSLCVCNCNFGWNILFRETRVCARIHAFLSLSSLQIHRVRMYRGWT